MPKKFSLVVILIAALAVTGSAIALASGVEPVTPLTPAPSAETGQAINETPQSWFVELSSPPTVDGTSRSQVRAEKSAFRSAARQAGLQYTERFAFDVLWNGLSILMPASQLPKLYRITGVAGIYPVATIPMPETNDVSNPELLTALAMTGADVAQSELGFTGLGVKVGVIDTGIDYDHPDLGGDGTQRTNSTVFPTARVIAGYDFVGDAYDAGTNPVPVPDPYPDDCAGHGTHVAGIIGANGAVKGVAPDVHFGAYRVFGCAGSTSADIMIAAMERAFADGMQVVNMSIGSAFQWPEYPTAQASTRLVNHGVVVVASAGNDGPSGLYATSAPAVGDKVISVASFDNTHTNLNSFTISPDGTTIGYIAATGAPPPPLSGTFPMARTGTPTTTDDGCAALPPGSMTGKVVLIRRGTCTFYAKSFNAQSAGAVGVVLYNNTTGFVSPTVAGTPPITIPVVSILATDGVLINNRLASGPVNLTWTANAVSIPNATGGLISSFSSYGLSPELAIKPNIGAPGGFIRSTYPIELGSYANLSGTSMSSPHVAGAVALLLQAKPHTPPQAVGGILQNSAIPALWWGNPGLGFLDNVHRQGAGMLRIDNAILATTKIQPSELALGEGQGGPATRTLSIENDGSAAVTYNLSSVNALSTGGVITPSFTTSNAIVTFSAPSVTVPAGGTRTVDVTVMPATGPTFGQYGGYVILTPQGGGLVYRVPFAGFVGDYQSIVVLQPTANGFPWLAKLTGGSYFNQPGGATYSMSGGDIAYFLVHLDHQPRTFQMDVFDAVTGKAWHTAFKENYLPRNSTTTSFFAFAWDGTTFTGGKAYTLPNGQYIVKLSVLKALGDASNPADVETWTSPVVTIQR